MRARFVGVKLPSLSHSIFSFPFFPYFLHQAIVVSSRRAVFRARDNEPEQQFCTRFALWKSTRRSRDAQRVTRWREFVITRW